MSQLTPFATQIAIFPTWHYFSWKPHVYYEDKNKHYS